MMNFSAIKTLTRFEQTLFGLPFVLAAVTLVTTHRSELIRLMWILPAFIAARSAGMAFNQLIDRHIDAKNPRTKMRLLPQGAIQAYQVRGFAFISLFLFLLCCIPLGFACMVCACVAAFLICMYSYIKRIHVCCHFVLGAIHFLAVLMASLAIKGEISLPVVFLGAAAFCSIAGNDIIYAIEDYEFDCKEGLYSIPSKYGIPQSILFTKILHVSCICCLIATGFAAKCSWSYFLAPLCSAMIFVWFHQKKQLFFLSNALVAAVVFTFTLIEKLWHG